MSLIIIYMYFGYVLNAKRKCATVLIITSLCRMFTVVWSLTIIGQHDRLVFSHHGSVFSGC